ncbi:MAG: transposase [Acidobacteriia bacterium]|nr:transposase [Terriglobia bacterium]
MGETRRKIAAWRREYNEGRPHSLPGYRTLKDFATEMRGLRRAALDQPRRPQPQTQELRVSYDSACGEWGQVTSTDCYA